MKGRVLIIDSNRADAEKLRGELAGAGYEVLTEFTRSAAVEVAETFAPIAIVTDPFLNGTEAFGLLREIRARQPHTPIILTARNTSIEIAMRSIQEEGAYHYFEKPIDFEALRACLRQTATSQRTPTRTEVRVRLRLPLKLGCTDSRGKQFSEVATTENVSLSGFLCGCTAELSVDSIVDVYLTSRGEPYVGKAKIVHLDSKSAPLRRYGCRFIEKTGPWVLQ